MDESQSLSPTEVVARIEAEQLPESLENTLSQLTINKLKQLQYEHGKAQRRQKALKLIQDLQQQLKNDEFSMQL